MMVAAFGAFPSLAQEVPALTPPIAQAGTDVPYPAGGHGDAIVLLELLVERDGTVSRASVVEGAEPFADRARSAAMTWRFAPAVRGETPVAAKIRVRVEFHQEQPAPGATASGEAVPGATPATPPATTSSTPESKPVPDSALEVTVRGRRRDIGQATLSSADVREMPGAFGDPFRAVEALPSVAPVASGLPYFYIRGAPPNDNGYFVDGIRVPLLFHVGVAQGVIHPALIDHVDFFTGAAPARYGDVAGAVIAGQTRDPATTMHGEANLRLVDAGGLVEAPIAGGRGSVLLAGRYGYPGPILGAFTSNLTLDYWDYQARATSRVARHDTLAIFAFGSHDYLATPSPSGDPTAPAIEQFVSDFHRVDLRYDHELADGRIRIAVTGGADRRGAAPTYITDRLVAARLEVDQRLSPTLRSRGGASVALDAYGFKQNQLGPGEPIPVPSTADPPPTNRTASVHADFAWRPTPGIEIVPGARFAVFDSSRASRAGGANTGAAGVRTTVPAADPRLAARVAITPSLAWLTTLGLAHQYPVLRASDILATFVSVPGFPSGDTQLQLSTQASQGIEIALPAEIVVSTTGFLSRWTGLTDVTNATCASVGQPPAVVCPADQPVNGYAYGFELLARRPLSKRLTGWLSYTLSRSMRDTHLITPAGEVATARVASDFDRTHVLNALAAYDLGARWRLGARSVFYTGTPYSRMEGGAPVPPYNGYRNPSFFRLDVRIEKRWTLGKSGTIALIVEGQNVTLSTEVVTFGHDCMGSPGTPTRCTQVRSKIGPITIPSLGVEVLF